MEAEGRGSGADVAALNIQQSMKECIKCMILAVGINTKQNNQEINNILGGEVGRLKEYQKGFLGVF